MILPVIYEHKNIEIDLVLGESSGNILGIRYYTNAPETEEEVLPEEINLLANESMLTPESKLNKENETEDEDAAADSAVDDEIEEEDTVWDLCWISDKQINGEILLSFIFSFEKYFADAEKDAESQESISPKIPKDLVESRPNQEEKDIMIKDPFIKIEIFSAKGRVIGARIKKYDMINQKEEETLGTYVLDGELFRRQIFF